ncbi:hypothetical protein [Paenibacillus soyae]|uniref:DUF2140 family protein n=1 Tax=Paenibacillus soyae TaxID=2969249 RepID=A0A9X2MQA1_9BACL|nr:hypothetical protein [Paenibacillus soyae]MCR2804224.1 hypothetical protein [Paenibacillus soyae]
MGRFVKRLFLTLVVLAVLLAGAAWGLMSYIAPEETLDLNYEPIDLKQKALDMATSLKPELILTEQDINDLIKKHLERDIAENVRLDGARFSLQGNRLIADLNVTYMERIPAQVKAEYRMEWQDPNLTLHPRGLFVKGLELPFSSLETIIVPLDLPTGDMISVKEVRFEGDQVRVLFKINMPF